MSTDQTPALARAAEEFRKHRAKFSEDDPPPSCTGCGFVAPFDAVGRSYPAFHAHRIAAAVSAALTNDADPDWLARALHEHRYRGREDDPGWDGLPETHRIAYRLQVDAVRAALLGGDA